MGQGKLEIVIGYCTPGSEGLSNVMALETYLLLRSFLPKGRTMIAGVYVYWHRGAARRALYFSRPLLMPPTRMALSESFL